MLKAHMKPLTKGGQTVKHAGKGASEQTLPSRNAMSSLTSGDQTQRSMNNYAKQTPMPTPMPSGGMMNPAMDAGAIGGVGKSGGI